KSNGAMSKKRPPGHRRPSDRQPITAKDEARTAVTGRESGVSKLAGLMKTLASVSARCERSASERGGKGRNAKFHQTHKKSRLLKIDRESKKHPVKLRSQPRPMSAIWAQTRHCRALAAETRR